jgi:hypothetical protein
MGRFWHDMKISLRDGYQKVSEKTGEMTRIGKLKIEILTVKREIERLLLELGGRLYQMLKETPDTDIRTQHLLTDISEKIKPLEVRLKYLNEEVERIRKESGGLD